MCWAEIFMGGGVEFARIQAGIRDIWKWLIPGGAVACYLLLLAKIATSAADRFYLPVYAVMIVVVIAGVKELADQICRSYPQITEFFLLLWVALMLVFGWNHGIGNLYRESAPLLEAMKN